jgi:SNF2 family DNA or RNA helicase
MREYEALRISQRVIVERIIENDCYMIAADMGVGKTGACLTAIRQLLDTFMSAHVLVVAPLLVAEETWPDEIETWRHTDVLHYEVLTGDPERREQRARRLPELSIINKENLPWLVELWGDAWPYDTVFIDEMSGYKNPKKRNKPTKVAIQRVIDGVMKRLPRGYDEEDAEAETKKELKKLKGQLTRFGALCKVRKFIDRIYGLTGTPTPNGMLDIWSQYYLLDQGKRLGTAFTGYRSRWFEGDYMGFKYAIRPGSFDHITEKIRDITISMKTEDFSDMPDVVYNTITVKLPPKVMKQYKDFEKSMILDEHDIEAVNSGVLTGKLLQLANGSVYNEDGEAIEIHDLKLEALDRVIEEAAGAPVLVAYSYQFDLAKLKKRYPHAEVVGETPNLSKRWNNGEIQLLLAHPQSAGHGLNLQYGGCITVWYGLCWSLEYYQQLNKRLHRPGQLHTVFIHHIVAQGTMDMRVMEVLPQKDATQEAFIEATRWVPN